MLELSLAGARALLLDSQGLFGPNWAEPTRPSQPTKGDVLSAIRRMGMLQLDTIHVVARSPYFVLWSRLGPYDQTLLDELLVERGVFETWAHEASIMSTDCYPLFSTLMHNRQINSRKWITAHPDLIAQVRAFLEEKGEARSADFRRAEGEQNGWWNWKPEKRALEAMFGVGEVYVVRRENFHRVYSLRERVLPNWDDSLAPSYDEAIYSLTLKSLLALGVSTERWLPDYYRLPKADVALALERALETGDSVEARVDGIAASTYVHRERVERAGFLASGEIQPELTTLLSPFDPIVWDRSRAKALFSFDYRIECYTPAPKRVFGYFLLPILSNGRLVGRLDAKAHRKDGIFEVKSVYLEDGVLPDERLIQGLREALASCASWHKTPEVRVVKSSPEGLAAILNS